jgi:hypothetical protein
MVSNSLKFFLLSLLSLWISLALPFTGNLHGQASKKMNPKYSLELYSQDWQKIDSESNKGKPQTALKLLNNLLDKASKDKNPAQMTKALIYELKLRSTMEEEELVKGMSRVQSLLEDKSFGVFPLKPLLHSMLAELYWRYFESNRYKFLNRTTTTKVDEKDIRTWDLNSIAEFSKKHYLASLENSEESAKFPIENYAPIINENKAGRTFRPSLYDFLAHRAIDFFLNTQTGLPSPKDKFILEESPHPKNPKRKEFIYLAEAPRFFNANIQTNDTASFLYQGISVFQKLLKQKWDEKEKNPNEETVGAYIDAELKRINYIYENTHIQNKDKALLSILESIYAKHSKFQAASRVKHQVAQFFANRANGYNPASSSLSKWDKKTADEICNTVISRHPNTFGAQQCQALKSELRTKNFALSLEKQNLPNEAFFGKLSFQNIDNIYIKIYKFQEKDFLEAKKLYRKSQEKSEYRDFMPIILDIIKSRKEIKAFSRKLPDEKDFHNHSVELDFPALDLGEYIVLTSDSPEFSYNKNAVSISFFQNTRLSYIQRQANKFNEFYVIDRKTGLPLEDVNVEVIAQEYHERSVGYKDTVITKLKTDKNGYFEVPLHSSDHKNYYISLKKGNDSFEGANQNYFETYYNRPYKSLYNQNNYYREPEQNSFSKVFFFTDRAIYRPGQTLYFKGLYIQVDGNNNSILPGSNLVITLLNPNGQKVSDIAVKSNEYGTFSGTFTLPQGGLNGQYQIRTERYSHYFSVEDYKRPKFEVTINTPKEAYRLKDNVAIKGIAKAYSGAVIDNAKVQYRVIRKAIFPSWYYFWGYIPASSEREILNGEATTNEKGEFQIEFLAVPDETISPDSKPSFQYNVTVDVTDMNGETQTGSKTIVVGYVALNLEIDIPNVIAKEQTSEWKISSNNLNGEPEPSEVKIEIHKLKSPAREYRSRRWSLPDKQLLSRSEWEKLFPYDAYHDEDRMYKWDKEKLTFQAKVNTKEIKQFIPEGMGNWESGAYVLEAHTLDKYGVEVKDIRYFTLVSPKETKSPYKSMDLFIPFKTTGEPEDILDFLINSDTKNTALYEIEQDGRILHSEWLRLDSKSEKGQFLISEKIKPEYRGNFGIRITFVRENRVYSHNQNIFVPYTNKELEISYETFRNKLLPGSEEEWKLKIKGKMGDKVAAEMLATMYDASLDAFRKNSFAVGIYKQFSLRRNWNMHQGFEVNNATLYQTNWNERYYAGSIYYDSLNWFGYNFYTYYSPQRYKRSMRAESPAAGAIPMELEESDDRVAAPAPSMAKMSDAASPKMDKKMEEKEQKPSAEIAEPEPVSEEKVQVRSNFSETAFFYPHLETDKEGSVIIKFKIPDSLTKWKFLSFAHTKDLMTGISQNEVITQKDLMVVPNAPRFFREGDDIHFSSKVTNLTDKPLKGQVSIELFDAITNKPIDKEFGSGLKPLEFNSKPEQSSAVEWKLQIPAGISAVTYRIIAKSGNFSDGEEMTLPILTNRMLVTESLPLPIRGQEKKVFEFKKLLDSPNPNNSNKSTLRHHSLTLEFTPRPAWYAVQALPYLMEYPYECIEQTFSRYYANILSSHIVNSDPKIKKVFEAWQKVPDSEKGALSSNLEKNQELKALLLEETPWVRDAQDESERKKRISLLFDINRMSSEMDRAFRKIKEQQLSEGAWSWFKGLPPDRYITQYIVTGMGQLDHLKVKSIRDNPDNWKMISKAIGYMDNKIIEDLHEIKRLVSKKIIKLEDDNLHYMAMNYLYARSFFVDIPIPRASKEAFDYFLGQSKQYWLKKNRYSQGMLALALHRFGEKKSPNDIIISLKENAIYSEEMGMYWNTSYGYHWYELPIETHSLMIEVFDEVANDEKAVDGLKTWLLKQKQTTDWRTTKATANAIYALLLKGEDWLSGDDSNISILLGKTLIQPGVTPDLKVEEGTGYFKKTFPSSEILPEMGKITVEKKNKGVSWGALYWQYFENLDKITPHETPLKLKKELFLQKNTDKGPVLIPISNEQGRLKVGDLVKVRIELRVDRNMEYVHMKDMRAAGFEPINVFSTNKYQDGLHYYESTRDAATNFFFGYLPKGTHVFEYPLRVGHKGNFSNGITTIQCMYAPEFSSHSEGIRVNIE